MSDVFSLSLKAGGNKLCQIFGLPDSSAGEESPATQETLARFLGWENPLVKGKATHSGILAWRIP